ncbi:unnamed protein product, partial [Rotaria socialis]
DNSSLTQIGTISQPYPISQTGIMSQNAYGFSQQDFSQLDAYDVYQASQNEQNQLLSQDSTYADPSAFMHSQSLTNPSRSGTMNRTDYT